MRVPCLFGCRLHYGGDLFRRRRPHLELQRAVRARLLMDRTERSAMSDARYLAGRYGRSIELVCERKRFLQGEAARVKPVIGDQIPVYAREECLLGGVPPLLPIEFGDAG